MSELVKLFADNLLPIFLAAGVGFPLGKWLKVEARSLSQVVFYIFSPCLVFNLLTHNQLAGGDILRMMGFAAIIMLASGFLAWVGGVALRLERRLLAAVVLAGISTNAGNFGLPMTQFAFGEQALAHASLYFITSVIIINTLGVVVASLGKKGLRESLLALLKIPAIYSLTLATLLNFSGRELPLPIDRTVTLLGNAAVPGMLVLMGLQLQGARLKGEGLAMGMVSLSRLVASPLLAVGLSLAFGLQGPARQAGILEAGMPCAVLSTVLATEYDVRPDFVTATVFISTLLSPLTLTPLLLFLGR